jgi:hypothetical protein
MTDSKTETAENTQKAGTETDEERFARTSLSSLQMDDDASKAVQKTDNRVALSRLQEKVVAEEFIHPASIPHMTIAVLTTENGFALVGKAAPADAENYNEELGQKFAREDAMRQFWPLEAYLLRQSMWEKEQD